MVNEQSQKPQNSSTKEVSISRSSLAGRCLRFFRRRLFLHLGILGLSLLWFVSARAEDPPEDDGFWLGLLKGFAEWFLCFVLDTTWPVFIHVLELIPTASLESANSILVYLATANTYVAVDQTAICLVLLANYFMIYIVVRTVVKLLRGT
jgi:hypothetical protein